MVLHIFNPYLSKPSLDTFKRRKDSEVGDMSLLLNHNTKLTSRRRQCSTTSASCSASPSATRQSSTRPSQQHMCSGLVSCFLSTNPSPHGLLLTDHQAASISRIRRSGRRAWSFSTRSTRGPGGGRKTFRSSWRVSGPRTPKAVRLAFCSQIVEHNDTRWVEDAFVPPLLPAWFHSSALPHSDLRTQRAARSRHYAWRISSL